MSGIYGLFRKDGLTVEKQTLQAMRGAMEEWGPDAHGDWIAGNLGMGFLLMRNTPESFCERLPLQDADNSRYVLTADARIDNRDELCDHFRISKPERKTVADSQLIWLAFDKWGAECSKYLVGAYAFAVWDCREQRLMLARDHMGFRPLYVYEDARKFVFASDVQAVLAVGDIPKELDEEAIAAARMQYTRLLRERSLYRGINKLPPAHTLAVTSRSTTRFRYWDPTKIASIRFNSNDEYAEQMRILVQEAVKSGVRSAFPVGSHLSGGLDSSAVTVLAAQQFHRENSRLDGVFAWSPAPQAHDYPLRDERARVEAVCERVRVDCTYSDLTTDDILQMWQRDLSLKPQDTMYNEPVVRRQAVAKGIRTLLSGWGGDEFATFNGRGYFSEQFLRLRWHDLWAEMQKLRQARDATYKSLVVKHLILPLLPAALYRRRRNLFPAELMDDPHISQRAKHYLRLMATDGRPRSSLRQNQISAFEIGWLTYRIEGWAAQSLENRIEYRYPLLDRRVLEYCLGLPPEQFVRNGWTRYVFRNAMTDILPECICWDSDIKVEEAKVGATTPLVAQASQLFIEGCQSGRIRLQGVSSMWQDKLLPI